MGALTNTLDLSTRYMWRVLGRPVDVDGDHSWLAAPSNPRGGKGDDWLDQLLQLGRVRPPDQRDGLVQSMSDLDGPDFSAGQLRDEVRDFYEHTASWRMDVWSQWNALFAPGGELIARGWGRRVEQLALPIQPLSVSRGMSSVIRVVDEGSSDDGGARGGAAWLRNLRSDGSRVYSGYYRVSALPGIASRTCTSRSRWRTGAFRSICAPATRRTAPCGSIRAPGPSATTVPTPSCDSAPGGTRR